MDWKEQLDKKEKELNLIKGGKDVCIRSDSRIDTGINSRGVSRSICLSSDNKKELNNITEKGGNRMITVEGALKDLGIIEKETDDVGAKAIVQAFKVLVKFLSTMRSNQLLTDEEKVNIRKAREARTAKEAK